LYFIWVNRKFNRDQKTKITAILKVIEVLANSKESCEDATKNAVKHTA